MDPRHTPRADRSAEPLPGSMLAPLTAPAGGGAASGAYDPATDPEAPLPRRHGGAAQPPAEGPGAPRSITTAPLAAPLAVTDDPTDPRCIESRVLHWPDGIRVAEAHLTRMARRGLIACADVWVEVGAAVGTESAPAYLVPVHADGTHEVHQGPEAGAGGAGAAEPDIDFDARDRAGGPAGRTPDRQGPLVAYPGPGVVPAPSATTPAHPTRAATQGPQQGARVPGRYCRVLAEPFAPAWAVLAARALDHAGHINRDPQGVTAFLAAAAGDAGLYGRVIAALVSTLGAGGDRAADSTRDVGAFAGRDEDAASSSRCVHTAMRWAVDASEETRSGAWRRYVPQPSRYASVAGGVPVILPAGTHPVVAVYLAHAAQRAAEAARRALPRLPRRV